MPSKKQRIDASWIGRVVDLLQAQTDHTMDVHDVYVHTKVTQTTQTDAFLGDHPSIHMQETRLSLRPFANVANASDLVAFLEQRYPQAFRLSDLHGLYPFVTNDVHALVFEGRIQMLDPTTQCIAGLPMRRLDTLRLRERLYERLE